MNRGRILRNSFASAAQVLVVAASLFLLYRYLLKALGAEDLGVWSVVFAATSVGRMAELGLNGSVVKFVSAHRVKSDEETVARLVQTAFLAMGGVVGGVLLLGYPLLTWALGYVIPAGKLSVALAVLPFAVAAFWVRACTEVLLSALQGCQRFDTTSALVAGGTGLDFLLALVFVPGWGLMGLAWARAVQALILVVVSTICARREIPGLPAFPRHFSRSLFREMFGYGVKLQVVSAMVMLVDPVTKGFLSRFSGLASVAWFEMAGRMVFQVRAVIVTVNRVVVPLVADLVERDHDGVRKVFADTQRLVAATAFPALGFLAALTPFVSEVWIGRPEPNFVLFAVLLTLGWGMNILCGPAYFVSLGTGRLRWNIAGHVVIGILNAALGGAAGLAGLGAVGIVSAFCVALVFGSLLIARGVMGEHGIPRGDIVPVESRLLALTSIVAGAAGFWAYGALRSAHVGVGWSGAAVVLLFAVLLVPVVWRHPLRQTLTAWMLPAFGAHADKLPGL